MDNIGDLMGNDWTEECKVPWGSKIVHLEKPCQEHIENIKDFVLRMCVLYRGLNKVTRPFEYQIPRRVDAISIIAVSAFMIYIFTVDANQGYHQVTV